jgi:hypothetical protein
MLAAYAAGEQVIGRQVIEEVADNLDLLPPQPVEEEAKYQPKPATIFNSNAKAELANHGTLNDYVPAAYRNGNGNGAQRVHQEPVSFDDELLEIDDIEGFTK